MKQTTGTWRRGILLCAVALIAAASTMTGQVITGTILGTVHDASGGAVSRALVAAVNTGTNARITGHTSASGEFAIPLLPPGTYDISIEAPGFRTFRKSGIVLTIDSKHRVEAVLQVGDVASTVEVVADVQTLQTDSSDLNATLSRPAIESLPNVARNPMQLLVTVPGLVPRQQFESLTNINTGDDARRRFSNFTVNGSRPNSSEILLDGAPNTNMANNEVSVLPNVDAIGEMKIITNAYSAEFGRVAGGVISFGTKSGTNQYHGSLYEGFRNPVLNANSFGNNSYGRKPDGSPVSPKGKFNLNQFGGTFSGPVTLPGYSGRDKTFFFVAYEGLRYVQDRSSFLTVPTELERHGDFSQSVSQVRDPATNQLVIVPRNIHAPFASTTTVTDVTANATRLDRQQFQDGGVLNKIPSQYINPIAQKFLNFYPLPNSTPQNPDGTSNYFDSNSRRVTTDQIIVKLDQNFSDSRRAFVRYTNDWTLDTPANRFREGNPDASSDLPVSQFNPSLTVGYTWALSPTSIIDVRANATRINLVQKPKSDIDLLGMGFSKEMVATAHNAVFPYILGFSGYQSMGTGQVIYRDNHNTNYSFTGSYTKVLDKWTLKFGGEYRNILANLYQPTFPGFTFATTSMTTACRGYGVSCPTVPVLRPEGHSTADFLIGALDGQRGNGQYATGEPSMAMKFAYYGFYSQNDWKATRNLTINIGVRWDYQAPGTDRFNHLTQFNREKLNLTGTPGVLIFSGVDGVGRGQTEKDLRNWGPRVGFAYRLGGSTTIRAAYGITYDQITGNGTGSDGFGVTGFGAPAFMRIRPESGYDILVRPFNDSFNGGGVIVGANPGDARHLSISFYGFDRNGHTPYIQQWNFTVQRSLPADVLVSAAYVGTKGTRNVLNQLMINQVKTLPRERLDQAIEERRRTGINPLDVKVPNPFYGVLPAGNPTLTGPTITQSQLELPFPAWGDINMFNQRLGSSNYHSLQLTANRAFKSGFEIAGSYVWSKNIDFTNHFTVNGANAANGYGSDSYPTNWRLDRSVANSDIPHRAVIHYVFDLPFGRGRRLFSDTPVLGQVLGGWRVSGITSFSAGLPLSITGGGFNRPDLVADPVLPKEYRCFGDGVTPCPLPDGGSIVVQNRRLLVFNPKAYRSRWIEVPRVGAPGTQFLNDPYYWGTAPRYDSRVRGFGINNSDFGISREFRLKERARLFIRVDAANVFNRANFYDSVIDKGFGNQNVIAAQGPMGVSTSPTCGTASIVSESSRPPRTLLLTARIQF